MISRKIGTITRKGVNIQLFRIMQKLDISSRSDLVAFVDSCAEGELETRCKERLLN